MGVDVLWASVFGALIAKFQVWDFAVSLFAYPSGVCD
jgi:hypothetical protein